MSTKQLKLGVVLNIALSLLTLGCLFEPKRRGQEIRPQRREEKHLHLSPMMAASRV